MSHGFQKMKKENKQLDYPIIQRPKRKNVIVIYFLTLWLHSKIKRKILNLNVAVVSIRQLNMEPKHCGDPW